MQLNQQNQRVKSESHFSSKVYFVYVYSFFQVRTPPVLLFCRGKLEPSTFILREEFRPEKPDRFLLPALLRSLSLDQLALMLPSHPAVFLLCHITVIL